MLLLHNCTQLLRAEPPNRRCAFPVQPANRHRPAQRRLTPTSQQQFNKSNGCCQALPPSAAATTVHTAMGVTSGHLLLDADHHHHHEAAAAAATGWPGLLLTCLLMFLGAYGCGVLPQWLPQDQQRTTSAVNAVGAGLLLGSALCIILPEGFEAAMEADPHPPGWAVAGALLAGVWVMLMLDSLSHWLPGSSSGGSSGSSKAGGGCHPHRSKSDIEQEDLLGNLRDLRDPPGEADAELLEQGRVLHPTGGTLNPSSSSYTTSRADSPSKPRAAAVPGRAAAAAAAAATSAGGAGRATSGGGAHATPSTTAAAAGTVSGGGSKSGQAAGAAAAGAAAGGGEWWRPWLLDPTHHVLLGLLVHAVSDGLAVGAAALSHLPQVSIGVATAMVVHKGPVAVGLTTVLRGAQWSPRQVHRGLQLFAAASPVAAICTYGLLSALPGVTDNIPLVVLFSGGTVLYTAMHILAGHREKTQIMFVSLGMLLPLVLSAFFGHEHEG